MARMRFPNDLAVYRHRTGRTQEDVGQLLGISQYKLSNYETGLMLPTFEEVAKLSALYEVPISLLFPDPRVRDFIIDPTLLTHGRFSRRAKP